MSAPVGILLNYRDFPHTINCASSLLNQGVKAVLVIDNSADGGICASLISAHFDDDSRVVVSISARNLGFAAGVNTGIAQCRASHPGCRILLINNDAVLLDSALEKLGAALDESPRSVFAFSNIDQRGRVSGPAYYHRMTGLLTLQPMLGSFMHASGCCLFIDTSRIGDPLFDEDFFMYGEDCELGWRLSTWPESMAYVEETLVYHEGTASSGLGSAFYEERMVAAHWILAKKLSRGVLDRWALYACRTVMLTARGALRSVRFTSMAPIKALWTGWKLAFVHDPMRVQSS